MVSAASDCTCASVSDIAKACCASKKATDLSYSFKCMWAEVSVRPALPRPVAQLLCNRQVLRVVRDGLAKVPLRPIRVAEVRVRLALPRPVAHLLCHR
jgi:uncharacterized protein YqjF (DUF2071 family)